MNIVKPLNEGEATYRLENMAKIYRTRTKLFVFNTPQRKKYANLENRKPDLRGQKILNQQDREAMNKSRSTRRSRTKISDIIEMNDFAWFGTLTTSQRVVNRYDDDLVKKRVTKSLSNLQRIYRFEYLLVPERHKDGALHFHALLTEIPKDWLRPSAKKHDGKGRPLFNLVRYNLGFSDFSRIENLEATAKYCAKYVTKSLHEQDKGKKRYWHSKGLKKPQTVENVDTQPYVEHPEAESWETEQYTGYSVPLRVHQS